MKQLLEMLTYKRPHGSASEHAFIEKYILPLAPRVLSSPAPAPREPLFGHIASTPPSPLFHRMPAFFTTVRAWSR